MRTDNSILDQFVTPLMASVKTVMNGYYKPNGNFDAMPVSIGVETITSMKSPPHVHWVPKYDDGYHVSDVQPDDAHSTYMTWTVCEVTVWGKDLDEAESLRGAVFEAGANLYGAAWSKPYGGKGSYSKGLSMGEKGVTIKFMYAFKVLLLDEQWPSTTVISVNFQPTPGQSPSALYGLTVSDNAAGTNKTSLPT